MKVFAEFIENNGLQFRTKTLLQFGDSWDLIGSIVMKNPGSAKPGIALDDSTYQNISNFLGEKINSETWSVSGNDPTIRKIATIFNGNHVDKDLKLNGIIQIYNLYNICEPKIKLAYEKAENASQDLLYIDLHKVISEFKNKPVYLGFFHFYTYRKTKHSEYLQNTARGIFDYVKNSKFNYFSNKDIIDNPYYHPYSRYVYGEKNIPLLNRFISFYE
ncbi:hypothetical protein [Chryseobacterium schmidteae]|uniref:hypothetical protein n=1 Tax=Chryseobacterium schmidteae TaxID=2730404 RepID=UPI001589AEA2|nr:hypothetical protein [Chryseobacterium schmidteae]